MMAHGVKTHTSGGFPLETVGELSQNPLNNLQEKQANQFHIRF
jgi:hypothetical protein